MNYSIVHKALCKYNIFKFNTLQSYFPNLRSIREFITSENYLGGIKIEITSRYEILHRQFFMLPVQMCLARLLTTFLLLRLPMKVQRYSTQSVSMRFSKTKGAITLLYTMVVFGYSQNDSSVPASLENRPFKRRLVCL